MALTFGNFLYDAVFVLSLTLCSVYVYFKYSYTYWKKKGVPYLEPSFPYGNNTHLVPKTFTFAGEAQIWYNQLKAKGHKFGGAWTFARPVLVLVDPDYIRDVLTKDFHHFIDRDAYVNESDVKSTHLFNIRESEWKPLRQKLTPTFTSGKMKVMFDSVLKCSDFMMAHLEKIARMGDDLDSREVLASFTTDVIFTVAFGIESNSFSGTPNEYREQGKRIFRLGSWLIPRRIVVMAAPELARKLGVKAFPPEIQEFFSGVLKNVMEYRKNNNVRRPDFLQLLLDMHNNYPADSDKHVSFDEIVANTIIFFIAGFDTSSSTMNFTLYNLARNPEIQEKAREEILKVLKNHDGKITYESIQDMTYLLQVMEESMRLFPPLQSLARICTKDYRLRDTDIVIEKGTSVAISTIALGMDPDHFPNPEKFDPERFSPENKSERNGYLHLPFGEGPRNCIGLRFGIMQSKIGLVQILKNFRVSISPKTKMPLTIDTRDFLMKSNETLYVKLEKL